MTFVLTQAFKAEEVDLPRDGAVAAHATITLPDDFTSMDFLESTFNAQYVPLPCTQCFHDAARITCTHASFSYAAGIWAHNELRAASGAGTMATSRSMQWCRSRWARGTLSCWPMTSLISWAPNRPWTEVITAAKTSVL